MEISHTETAAKDGSKGQLAVEYISASLVKPYKTNPKKHSQKQVEQIVNSIKEFRFNNPLLIDENNELIAGHGRLLAARKLKLEKVPVIYLRHLTQAQKQAYRIADNKLTENGEWDIDLLKVEFANLDKLDLNFNLDITGFDTIEIDNLFAPPREASPKLNDIPFIEEGEVISKPGDIWQLGRHRIICADALSGDSFSALMGDKRADMIFTDPPYNVKIKGHVSSGDKHKEFAMASGEMGRQEFIEFLNKNFTLLKAFSKEGSLHYICMDWRHVFEISSAGDIYEEFKNICVWNKANAGMGSLYRSKHELIFVFKKGGARHCNNVELGIHGRYRSNVWDYAGVNGFGKKHELLKLHPTVKPVEMIWDAILDVTKRGDIVLDSFLGSGSTLIACEKAKRQCYGIELEPLYVDTAIRRWQDLTGGEAVRSDGKTYNSLLALKRTGAPDGE